MTFFSHCRVWPCSNNAGNTTWRRSNSSESSLTGTSLQENRRLVTASVLPKRKTNKRTKQKQTFVPLNVHVRAQVSAESKEGRGGEGRGAKEDVVNFKINVSPSRGYMKLSNWRFYLFAASGWFWRKICWANLANFRTQTGTVQEGPTSIFS